MKLKKSEQKKNGAELLVDCLKTQNVKYIFGIPGAAVMPIMESLRVNEQQGGPKFIITRHEQNAAFMAQAWGRITETPGVCLATAGPGATNLVTGVATATADRDPMVAITGETPRVEHFQKTHQTIRTATLFRPIAKWSEEIQDAAAIPEAVSLAFRAAKLPHEGAVNMTFPLDVQTSRAKGIPLTSESPLFGKASAEELQTAAEILARAKHPCLLLGCGATRAKTTGALRRFLTNHAVPVVGTFEAAGAISRDLVHLFVGRVGLKVEEPGDIALRNADCIITVGFDPIEYHPSFWHSKAVPIVHIDELPSEPHTLYQPAAELMGDTAKNLDSLSERVTRSYPFHPAAKKAQATMFKHMHQAAPGTTVHPLTFINILRESIDDTVTVCSDVGAHQIWLAKHFLSYEPRHLLFSMGFQTMGVSLPWAIAASLARPKTHIVSLSGDGSFMMSAMELETAVRLKLQITHIIWRDGSYNLVKIQQQETYKKTYGISFGNPDFVKLAQSFGAQGFRITKPSQIQRTLKKALSIKTPAVIDVAIDYRKNLSLLRPSELASLS
ncbi:acetolactate synthase AlsS [Candidatus Uhrbacteria bacterium]|nr:acetolactate synthase AlsS [Candidatus Uhrbacteria bacterium]